jgi:hypothetical protein
MVCKRWRCRRWNGFLALMNKDKSDIHMTNRLRMRHSKRSVSSIHLALLVSSSTSRENYAHIFLGMPKPIYQTNGMWSALGSSAELSQRHWPRGIVNEGWTGQRSLDPCPPQWLAGLHSIICTPIFMNGMCTMLPPDATGLSPELFKKIMAMNPVESLKCPPHTVATLYADPESRALLKSLKSIMFLGAALGKRLYIRSAHETIADLVY